MIQASSGKYCVLCGEDCSTRARVKDSHGNYYCKTCHRTAERRNAARKPSMTAPLPSNSAPEDEFDNSYALDDSGPSLPRASENGFAPSEVRAAAPIGVEDDDLLLLEDDDD